MVFQPIKFDIFIVLGGHMVVFQLIKFNLFMVSGGHKVVLMSYSMLSQRCTVL